MMSIPRAIYSKILSHSFLTHIEDVSLFNDQCQAGRMSVRRDEKPTTL